MDAVVKHSVCLMLEDAIVDEAGGIDHYNALHEKMLELSAKALEPEQKLITMMEMDIGRLHSDEKKHRITVKTMHKILGCNEMGL